MRQSSNNREDGMSNVRYLRRKQAGEYLQSKFGFGSPRTLAKLATVGGGPAYFKAGAKTVVYEPAALDAWAESQIGGACHSTSDYSRRAAS